MTRDSSPDNSRWSVGDEAILTPYQMSRFIAEVNQQGGRVELRGNVATVVYMPETKKEKPKSRRSNV